MSGIDRQEVARCWDFNAPVWTEQVRSGLDVYRELMNNPGFLSFLGDISGLEVLDVGCGEGYNTRILARSGAKMTGVDISARLIEFAVQEEQRQPLGIRYEAMAFEDLSGFPAESFDAVVSTMALMDGAGYSEGVREIARVLRPGGTVTFSILHPCFMTSGFGWMYGEAGEPEALRVSGYFDTEPHIDRWRFSQAPISEDVEPFRVPRFPRTLTDYINPLPASGLVLTRIAEPRPSEDACDRCHGLRKWRDHAAIFLYIAASKP